MEDEMVFSQFMKVYWSVFLAELGDKTNLATMAFAAILGVKLVILASSLALISVTILGGLVGGAIMGKVPPLYVELAAGGLFIVIGMTKLVPALATVLSTK